jgi:hypothetical protein
MQSICVFIGDPNRELVRELLHGRIDGRGVCEFGKDDKAHGKKRRCTGDSRVDHREHSIRVRGHLAPIAWVGQVGLTRGSRVTKHVRVPPGLKTRPTSRV